MAQDDAMTNLKKFFSNIAIYNKLYTQEKVYLHLDNNGYFPGETIWFKAYVVGAGTLLPTDMSKVLYVELLTPEGEVFQRKQFPILNGRTCGEFSLDDIANTGYYEVRAYTRAMLNWDNAFIFSRVIPVFDAPRDSLKYGQLTLNQREDLNDKAFRRQIPTPLIEKTTLSDNKVLMTFYPEGGYITKGLPSRVAFKIMDKGGIPLTTNVKLCRTDNSIVNTTKVIHDGMGVINVPTDWNGGYAEITNAAGKQIKFTLPQSRETGCDLSTSVDSSGNLTIKAISNSAFTPQTLGISVTCRGIACYFDTLHISSPSVCVKTILRKQLRDGIQQVTLFTSKGEILSERLVWIPPFRKNMNLAIAQNAKTYKPFSPIVLDFTLTDAQGTPQQGEFSLAVHDVEGELAPDGADINTELLLCSDLKGYIHKPEYYFESNDETHRQALDLLLMVQGWRRYSWQEMSGIQPFVLKQPVEDGLLIDGKIVDNSSKHRAKEGINVNLMIMLGGTFVNGDAKSDSAGNFALLAPDFYGDGIGYFTTTVNDKRKACNVALNRGFSPDPVAYEPIALNFDLPTFKEDILKMQPELFLWADTLPHIVLLPEAKVKDKMKLHPYGSRFTWMGGEDAGKRYASIYYNVEDALERILDNGERDCSLWEWLAKINPHLVVEFPTVSPKNSISNTDSGTTDNFDSFHNSTYDEVVNPILYYKGRPVRILLDNDTPIGTIDYLMSEIRSLVISEDFETYRKFNSDATDTFNGMPYVTFLLYSRIDSKLVEYRKGQRITVLHGYSKYEEFYSPNYRTMDYPTPEDVRRTLYWNPNVTTDKQGKANVLFFSNSRPDQQIRINAQGIAVTGQMFSSK